MKGNQHQARRALRFLLGGKVRVTQAGKGGMVLLEAEERGAISVPAALLQELCASQLVQRNGAEVRLAGPGSNWLKRLECGELKFARQHGEWQRRSGERGDCQINLAESPLAALARLREKSGKPYLRGCEVRAGERLRADFTYGQLTPRSGINWQSAGGSSGGGAAELADSVVASRQRVNAALKSVGPELSDVLIDICCFLKGIGQVEMERGWPARSAKLLLRTALAALARHYEPESSPQGCAGIRHWGEEDYRPLRFTGESS